MTSKIILYNIVLRIVLALAFVLLAVGSTPADRPFGFFQLLWLLFATNNVVKIIRFIPLYREFKRHERQ